MSYTLTETGKVLTETQDGCTMPGDYSFATVNHYVHGMDVNYEDLQSLCLGMASYIDGLHQSLERNCPANKQTENARYAAGSLPPPHKDVQVPRSAWTRESGLENKQG